MRTRKRPWFARAVFTNRTRRKSGLLAATTSNETERGQAGEHERVGLGLRNGRDRKLGRLERIDAACERRRRDHRTRRRRELDELVEALIAVLHREAQRCRREDVVDVEVVAERKDVEGVGR